MKEAVRHGKTEIEPCRTRLSLVQDIESWQREV